MIAPYDEKFYTQVKYIKIEKEAIQNNEKFIQFVIVDEILYINTTKVFKFYLILI